MLSITVTVPNDDEARTIRLLALAFWQDNARRIERIIPREEWDEYGAKGDSDLAVAWRLSRQQANVLGKQLEGA